MVALVLKGGPLDGHKIIGHNGLHFIAEGGTRILICPWQEIENSPELVGGLDLGLMI